MCSKIKNHFTTISVVNIRDISVQTRQLFAHFWPVKFWSHDRAPPNSVCIKHLLAPSLCPKFCFACQVVFELRDELISFPAKTFCFLCVLCVNSLSRDVGSPKLAHMTLLLILMLIPNFNFRGFFRFLVIIINPHLPKFANKNKGTTRSREVPITEQIVHYPFM